jgi:hypothetical protein
MYNDPNQPQQPPYGQPPYGEPPYTQPGNQPPYTQPTYPQQPYDVPPLPGYAQPQPEKKSRRWLWITLGIIGGVILISCAACAIVAGLGFNFFAQTIGPAVTADQYYQAIKNQNYAQAYTYLDTTGVSVQGQQVTQDLFVRVAQAVDTAKGPVTGFTTTNVPTDTSNNTATVTMSVTRGGQTYPVHLQLKKVGNSWKIVGADSI